MCRYCKMTAIPEAAFPAKQAELHRLIRSGRGRAIWPHNDSATCRAEHGWTASVVESIASIIKPYPLQIGGQKHAIHICATWPRCMPKGKTDRHDTPGIAKAAPVPHGCRAPLEHMGNTHARLNFITIILHVNRKNWFKYFPIGAA